MTMLKPKAAKRRKPVDPIVRLTARFIILCYQTFETLGRRPITLSLSGWSESLKGAIEDGELSERLPGWLWSVISSRIRKPRETCPFWPIAQAQAARFIEENRELIAGGVLST